MKMLKKLLAVVLTGAMALTLLTACGSNAVTEKDIADALNDMAKAEGTNVTFTPQAKEREMARKIAALLEGKASDNESKDEIKEILGCNEANPKNFVWYQLALTDGIGTSGQAVQIVYNLLNSSDAQNDSNLTNMEPADERHMGTALCKMREENGKQVTWRVIVVTAKAENEEDED